MRILTIRVAACVFFVLSLVIAPMSVRAGDNSWTPLGPPAFGNLAAFVVDPQTPTTLYAVTVGETPTAGIHKTTDGGKTWQRLDLIAPSGAHNVTVLTIDPTNSEILYAGVVDGGLHKSSDGGATWQVINQGLQFPADSLQEVSALAVDPQTPTTLYAGLNRQGLFRSTDGGATWSPIGTGLPPTAEFYLPSFLPGTILIDPQTPTTLYLKMIGEGVFKSVDAGATWQFAGEGLPAVPANDTSDSDGQDIVTYWLVPDPQTPTTLYVLTDQGIFKSVDGAVSWQPSGSQGLPPMSSYSDSRSLVVDPAAPQTLLVTVSDPSWPLAHLYRSENGGASWTPVTTAPLVGFALAITGDGQTPQTLYLYDRFAGLIYRSADGGATWAYTAFGGSNGTPISSLAVDPHDPTKLYAGVSTGGIFRTRDRGQTWFAGVAPQPGSNVSEIVVDPQTLGRLYATTGYGLLTSDDDGDSWTPLGAGVPATALTYLVIDPQTSTHLYAHGALGVLRSEDQGESWTLANAGLPLGPSGQSPEIRHLAIDPQTPTTLYAIATNWQEDSINGSYLRVRVFKSVDGARTWVEASKGLPDNRDFPQILVDPQTPANLYLQRNSSNNLTEPQLYRSVNGGGRWAAAAMHGLPNELGIPNYVEMVAVDPNRAGTLYATISAGAIHATIDDGFYSSVDGGDHWYALPGGLPQGARFSDRIAVDPTTLGRVYLATLSGVQAADFSATLAVNVVVLGTPPAADWTLTGPKGDFALPAAGGSHTVGKLDLGAYELSITPQTDYTIKSVCTQGLGAGALATAHAAAGQKVSCTFYAIAPDAATSNFPIIGH